MQQLSRVQGWLSGLHNSLMHPLARGRRLNMLWRSAQFALWSKSSPELKLFPWLTLQLIGTPGYSGYFRNQLHEYVDLCFAAHFLAADDFFVDAGANVGTWSLLAAVHAEANVLAIEPAPDTLRVLRANIAINGLERKIEVAPFALSDQIGSANMRGSGLTRSLLPALANANADDTLVETQTLAKLLAARIQMPALVKLDLEGHELPALNGAGSWLRERKIAAWSIEANTEAEAVALHKVMSDAGYLQRYYEPTTRALLIERPVNCKQTNLIFVRDVDEAVARLQAGKALSVFDRMI
jgi:FkbM family methyltransferase